MLIQVGTKIYVTFSDFFNTSTALEFLMTIPYANTTQQSESDDEKQNKNLELDEMEVANIIRDVYGLDVAGFCSRTQNGFTKISKIPNVSLFLNKNNKL